jgi:triphosphoribosyl-dephospho-CoA synthase
MFSETKKSSSVSLARLTFSKFFADFRLSYQVSAEPITNPAYSLGEKIYYAVKATREAVGCNTNLGIILLCAPLLQAANQCHAGENLRDVLQQILTTTTRQDADWVFKAIALAAPGGLGKSERQDVHQAATMTLTEAMKLAADKDTVARQYPTTYKEVFDFAILEYNRAFDWFGDSAWAAVAVYTAMLSKFPDSHIERKYGGIHTEWVRAKGITINQALSSTSKPEQLFVLLHDVDNAFKARGINPGTSADMTVVTVLTACLEQRLKDVVV